MLSCLQTLTFWEAQQVYVATEQSLLTGDFFFFRIFLSNQECGLHWTLKPWWWKEFMLNSTCGIFQFSAILRVSISCSTSLIVLSLCRINIDSTRLLYSFYSCSKTLERCYPMPFITIDFSKIYRPLGSALFYYSCSTSNISKNESFFFFTQSKRNYIIQRWFRSLHVFSHEQWLWRN